VITLLFRQQKTQLDTIVLDASVREQHGVEVEVTRNPVEKGSAISDHRRVQPRQVVIEGIITNTPLAGPNDAASEQVGPDGGSYSSRSGLDPTRVSDAYRDLLALASSSALVTVITHLETYEDMTLTSLSVPRNAPSTEALRFTATFVEVRLVENQQVAVSRVDRGNKKKDLHKKPGAAASQQQEEGSVAWYLKQYALADTPAKKAAALGDVSKKFGGGLPLPTP
jgi:hypothetical protein